MAEPDVRKGMPPVKLPRDEFEKRYRSRFVDPAFRPLQRELDAIVAAAWDAYSHSRKAPLTRKAGPALPIRNTKSRWTGWLRARPSFRRSGATTIGRAAAHPLINGSARSEHTCPGEMSKSWRLVKLAEPVLAKWDCGRHARSVAADVGIRPAIHPCKSCVSTSMPLCHWPCSCYPNYSLGQTDDWMNEIYPLWVAAHGILIVAPVNWYHAPTPLKAMMDRLVCADGGNPDPTSTHGKHADQAKALELNGWPYPRHLAGRHFGLVVHGDSVGAETLRRWLSDWLTDMYADLRRRHQPRPTAMSATWSPMRPRTRRWTRTATFRTRC